MLGLFPVGLEAKLEPAAHRLRLRIWPEPLTRPTHDPALTEPEEAAGRRYWTATAAADTEAGRRAAWTTLADLLGPARAAWVAWVLTPVGGTGGGAPVFPDVQREDPAHPFVPTAAALPDRWVVLGYRAGAQVLVHVGPPVARPLVAGLDLGADATGATGAEAPLRLPPRMRWMADFAAAVAAGMALEIPVPADLDRIDQLFVVGVGGDAAAGRDEVERLLTGHRYGRGFAFVPQGTPSNNSPAGPSGIPGPQDAAAQAYALERGPRTYGTGRSNGQRLAAALGIDPATVAAAPFSGAVPDLAREPDGFEPEIGRAVRTLLWMPVLGHFLEDLVGLEPARVDALRAHFLEHVSAAGPVPAVRVGDQPYGILPVTSVHAFRVRPDEDLDPQLVPVLRTIPQFLQTSALVTDRAEDLLNFTGRPRTFIESPLAPGTPFFSEFEGNASWLNEHSGGTIPTGWAQGPLKDLDGDWEYPPGFSLETIDRIPARALADDATPAALAALAALPPDALRAAAPEGAVLTRIARYALLLEWARVAAAAGEAALQGTTFLDGARAAAAANRALWLDLLRHAFDRSVPAPFPVDDAVLRRLAGLVGDPGEPAAGCPGAPRLAAFRAALRTLARVPADRLQSTAYPVLALTHVREDAWTTSLATRRLDTLRKAAPTGLVTGGFGWLLDVGAAAEPFPGEYIHAPSHDHAAAAAVLRSAAVRAGSAGSEHADIDLSSRRVRLAHWLVDGVRGGRALAELLGARFERTLVDSGGGALLPRLRRDFPGAGVVDGLALRAAPPALTDAAFTAALAELEDALDALADAVTAESVYQLVRGNPAGALLGVDDVARGGVLPALEVTRSPALGTALSHRVAAVVPAGGTAPGWPAGPSVRSAADPLLDAWCGHLLGPAASTVLTLDDTTASPAGGAAVRVGLEALGIGALDVVAATAGDGAELTARLQARARTLHPGLAAPAVRADTAWKDLLRLGSRIRALLARAEPLTRDALTLPGTAPAPPDDGDLAARAAAARSRLQALGTALQGSQPAPGRLAAEAAGFGIVVPGVAYDGPLTADQRRALAAGVTGRLAAAADRAAPRDRLRALVGDVLGLVAVPAAGAGVLASAATPPAVTFATDEARCAGWLEAMGRVRPALTRLADVLALAEISGRTAVPPLRIGQAPLTAGDPWIGLGTVDRATRTVTAARLSLVLHAPAGVDPDGALGGFLVDSWSDVVPPARRDTGLAVRNNGPNTRAPQAMLLAVAPDTGVPAWTTGALVGCLRDTLETVLLRQGLLFLFKPLTFLGRRTDGAGISYDRAGPPA